MIEALGWGWIAFGALWIVGMLPAYMVLVEICDAEMPLLLSVVWPFVAIVGTVWAFVQKIVDWANQLKAWWKAPLPPTHPPGWIDPEEG